MEAFEVKWIASQRPPLSEGAFRLQKFDAATTTQWLTMVDRGVERTSAKFGSLGVLFGRASPCELPLRRAKIVSTKKVAPRLPKAPGRCASGTLTHTYYLVSRLLTDT
eukprot:scaffold13037_cov57-Cyclotella_meneghiniana.AAC.4